MYYPRKDDQAQTMKNRYDTGLSLAQVAAEFGVSRQTVYMMFKRRGFSLRSRPEPLQTVSFNGRSYSMRRTGYYGATTGDRGLLHRHMWEAINGPIPDGFEVHHRDHDRTHNEISNFELLSTAEHAAHHGKGFNQHIRRALAHR